MLARREERQGSSLSPGPTGPSDAMHVRLGFARHVEVDDKRDAFHVQATSGNVGGHEYIEGSGLEAFDHALALGLGNVTGNARGTEAPSRQLQGHFLHVRPRSHEDDGGVGFLLAAGDVLRAGGQDSGQGTDLVLVGHDRVGLENGVHRRGLRRHGDLDRILQVFAGNLLDGRGHGSAEQRGQTLRGDCRGNGLHILRETHAEHLVGLVQHEHPHVRQVQRTLLDQVDHAPGSAHNDLRAPLEGSDLRTVGGTTVDGHDVEAGGACGKVLDRLRALHGELARRRQDEGLHVALVGIDDGQERKAECGGLAGAGLGDTDDVAKLQQGRDRGGLNGRWDSEAHVGDCREDLVGQSEAGEGHPLLGLVAVSVFLARLRGVALVVLSVTGLDVVVGRHSHPCVLGVGVAKPWGRAVSAPRRGLTHNNNSRIPRAP